MAEPGAADVVHYLLELPAEIDAPVTVEVELLYRKFDSRFLRHVERCRILLHFVDLSAGEAGAVELRDEGYRALPRLPD